MYYAVSEPEINSITLFNGLTVVCSSAGSFLLALSASIWIGAALSEKLTDIGRILLYGASPILVLLAVVFFGLACLAFRTRRSQFDIIRRESRSGE